jgi:tight adherence protein B
LIGLATPIGIVNQKRNARGAAFGVQLPEALTLIASSLRTGYSFMNACEMVINELPQPISQEFAW